MEAFNGFSKWLFFGDDGKIKHNDPVEQEKRIKYNDLISNLVMLHNLIDMTGLLQQLKQLVDALLARDIPEGQIILAYRDDAVTA
jgi:TnpA family transposase